MAEPAAGGPEVAEGAWTVRDGTPSEPSVRQVYRADGVEYLTYSNAFGQNLERVWYDDQVVYAVELDRDGKLDGEPERVEGQYNIYDSVPGMEKYSPLWQFNYVIVPRDYEPNTLRSEAD